MTKELLGYAGVGTQTSAGVFQDTGGDDSFSGAVPMLQSATTANDGSDPEGENFAIQVRLADQTIEANRDHYEYMIVTYGVSGGVYSWTRVETLESSNAGDLIDWDAISSDANSLRFTSISLPKLKLGSRRTSTTYSTTSTSAVAMSDTFTITPTNNQTSLLLSSFGYFRSSSTTNDTRSRIEFNHKNTSGVLTSSTFGAFIGYLNLEPTGTAQNYDTGAIQTTLDQGDLNSSGDWEFLIVGDVFNSGVTLSCFNSTIRYQEIYTD